MKHGSIAVETSNPKLLNARMRKAVGMIGVVDVGGSERGIYGAGVFDWCMEQGIDFDYCVGVSAGAANLCSYLAGQIGRTLDTGCEKVVVVLTRPRDYYRSPDRDKHFAHLLTRKHPQIATALENRAQMYNSQLDLAKKYEREGKVLIVAPDSIGNMGTLTKDIETLEGLYAKGLTDAWAIAGFLG